MKKIALAAILVLLIALPVFAGGSKEETTDERVVTTVCRASYANEVWYNEMNKAFEEETGIHVIVLGQVGVGFLELVDLLGVEHMDLPGVLAQLPILAECVDQTVPIDGCGLHADHHTL